ncbi:hypothetical protein ACFWBR_38185 [Streptomyces sp. NPDC060006]|uniref:hypothetical protein n=1 Tax=unclassified Streptomyces TaxID=2593676 RepID=UPI00369FFB08
MDLDGWAAVADAEFDEPLRFGGPSRPPAFLLGFPLPAGPVSSRMNNSRGKSG